MDNVGKVLKNDLLYVNLNQVVDGSTDIGINLNGVELINEELKGAVKLLSDGGMIKGDGDIIIPKGATFVKKEEFGGATEYTFTFNGNTALVDLFLEDEDELFE